MKRNALATIIISSFLLAAGPALAAKGYRAQARVVRDSEVQHRSKQLNKYNSGTCQSARFVAGQGGIDRLPFKIVMPKAALMPMVPKKLRVQKRDTGKHAEDRQLTLGETSVMTKNGKMPLKVVLTTNAKRAELALVVGEVSGTLSPKQVARLIRLESKLTRGEPSAKTIAKLESKERKMRLWGRKLSTVKNQQNQMIMLNEIDGWLQTARMPRPMNNKAWVGQLQALLNQAGQNMLLYRQGKLEAKAPDAKNPINYMLADKDF